MFFASSAPLYGSTQPKLFGFSLLLSAVIICLMLPPPAWSIETDPQLEQQLDQYLNILDQDQELSLQQLQTMQQQLQANTPPASVTRLYAMKVFYYLYNNDEVQLAAALEQLGNFARQHPSPDVMAEALATQVEVLFYQGQMNEAYQTIVELESFLESVKQPRIRFYANNLLGRIYILDNQFELASKHLHAAMEAVLETDDDRTAIRRTYLLSQLAQLHADMQNLEQGLELINQAIAGVPDKIKDHLPDFYLTKGYIEGELGQHEASIQTHYLALEQATQQGYQGIALLSLNNIGAAHILLHQYQQAIEPLLQAKELAIELEDEYTQQLVLLNLGYIEVMQGNYDEGLQQMRSSIEYYREHGRRSDLERFLTEFAKALHHAGYHSEEAAILREQRDLNKELFQADRERILAEMQQRFQAREQAHHIQRLEQANALQERTIENKQLQNRLILLAAFASALAGILMWQLYRKVRHINRRLKEANKQLEFQSLRDPLTGLFNRRSFQQRMAKRWQQKEHRHHGEERDALILLDIDFFKQINDQHGHAAGDDILIEVAKRLTQSLRQHDQAIRWGGEEFLLYLHRIKPKDLNTLVERTLYLLAEKPFMVNGQPIVVTATAGFITLPFDDIPEEKLNWEKALQLADLALYSGKSKGRNQACGVTGLHVPLTEIMTSFDVEQNQPLTLQQLTCSEVAGPKVHRT
ncbi:tetratricopeptide repeat-containing diguanylate cyclase [Alkalimonas amylolytica]|uniref:diguanylate cyclase n=1 Tax=Alkalimonas amylolytica TaxID=152573 RepID=A0A1H4BDB5_ALKAM|nr:diguanylate cyclase [Alkalimonas amylolytica]SEA46163.1 diguanylate cyclase (GGDEF) domain-containing protein [Alkalimonas amylolytica]